VTKKFNQYLGKAGHLNIMSEFLILGWNVAIPEVDIGDDIFVVQDDNGTLRRVQVKTATSKVRKSSYSGQFSVSVTNLRNLGTIYVHYVFLVRHNDGWSKPVIIRQDRLLEEFETNNVSSQSGANIIFYFSYSGNKVTCSRQDFTKYIRDFEDFPLIIH
jgi:hypothetical protein